MEKTVSCVPKFNFETISNFVWGMSTTQAFWLLIQSILETIFGYLLATDVFGEMKIVKMFLI
jgi:hypothetical protein